ncbi:MAG: phosphonate ABC transporter, permease protein PhnE [Anaerolineae bacterium]
MATVATSTPPQLKKAPVAGLLSLVVPGAGQAYLGRTPLGLIILATALFLAFVVNWALDNFEIGLVSFGGLTTSWLWLVVIAFWVWNAINAYGIATQQRTFIYVGILLAAIILYIIAWQVTDINLIRLQDRFGDFQKVASTLTRPDLITTDLATGRLTPSDNFGDLVGRIGLQAPPDLFVKLGLFKATDQITWFAPGTIFATIALGLMATFLSIFLAIPLSFLAAHNIVGSLRWPWSSVMSGAVGMIAGGIVLAWIMGLGLPLPAVLTLLIGLVIAIIVIVLVGRALDWLYDRATGTARRSLNGLLSSMAIGVASYLVAALLFAWIGGIVDITEPPNYKDLLVAFQMAPPVIGILGALLGLYLGLRLGDRPVLFGEPIYIVSRAFFNIMRSIDPLIWGLVVIVWVGQGAMAGVMALGIHSVAALAKLYSEEIEHIDPGPVEAVAASGGNLLQQIIYAVVPQIIPPFLAYTLLRWDINMRSATIVGFVAGGGIGYFVVETIRKGGYEQYAAALWIVAIVIILVDYISARWREQILSGENRVTAEVPQPFYRSPRNILYLLLGLGVFYLSWQLSEMDLLKLLDPGPTLINVSTAFLKFDLHADIVDAVVKQLLITTFQAMLATTIGGLVAIPFSFLAARNLTGRSRFSLWIYYIARAILNVLRSIEALLYVAVFVYWVGVGPFAGMMALAITTFALIGKLFSEAIEDIDPGPVEAITTTGATRLQSIIYGILPQIIPPFVSYTIYQWDINIRIAAIIGFAGGGGIGLLYQAFANSLQYHKAGTAILFIVVVVTLMDFASARVRQRLV